jgi:hypothetical protein
MPKSSIWQRVSKRRPCPVCEKPDWCLFAGDPDNPDAAICARIESPRQCGEAGWLHRLRDDEPAWSPWTRTIRVAVKQMIEGDGDLGRLARNCAAVMRPADLDRLAVSLGVSPGSLRRLGVGWSARHRAWTFPMRDCAGGVLGIRLRRPDGRKLSVRGGHEGLFIPEGIDAHGLLLVCEGPTDTAALLDLGFFAVGRPSCTGGVALLVERVRCGRPSGVAIVADGDAPGRRGAESLAAVLVAYAASVRIIAPPAGTKDAREWRRRGATRDDLQAVIDAAAVRRLSITSTIQQKACVRHG